MHRRRRRRRRPTLLALSRMSLLSTPRSMVACACRLSYFCLCCWEIHLLVFVFKQVLQIGGRGPRSNCEAQRQRRRQRRRGWRLMVEIGPGPATSQSTTGLLRGLRLGCLCSAARRNQTCASYLKHPASALCCVATHRARLPQAALLVPASHQTSPFWTGGVQRSPTQGKTRRPDAAVRLSPPPRRQRARLPYQTDRSS